VNGSGNADRIHVPCGRCINCLEKKRAEWTFRIAQELNQAHSAWFLTFTYNEEKLPINEKGYATLRKKDLQLFLKRLRKKTSDMIKGYNQTLNVGQRAYKVPKIKYFACGEYGTETKRPHYHMIIFNVPRNIADKSAEIWGNGHVKVGTVNTASIHYTTKYMITKYDELKNEQQKPFTMISNAMGLQYVENNKKWHIENANRYVINDGYKQSLPRYYQERIFDNETEESEHHKLKRQYDNDQRYNNENKRIEQLGNNPYKYRSEQIKQKIDSVNKKLKKGTL